MATYLNLVRHRLRDESDENDPVDDDRLAPISNGRSIQPNVTKHTLALQSFISAFCTTQYWGGSTQADQHNMRDIIQRFTGSTEAEPFSPNLAPHDGQSLLSLLTNIDQGMAGATKFVALWAQMATARAELIPQLDLLLVEPIALLYSNATIRATLERYLDGYAEVLRQLHNHAGMLNQRFRQAYRAILQGFLRLDVIFVLTPHERSADEAYRQWKAILTPLHPLHLWRYRTILDRAGPDFSNVEQTQLTQALPRLPHLLHFVATIDAHGNKITLPQAGNLETLPIYENRTNRYLGSDGIDFLSELLKGWLTFAPYSQPQIRLALIDVPYLPDALQVISQFMREQRKPTSVVIDAYRTRPQNVLEHLAEMDFEGQDSAIAERLLDGSLSLNLYESDSLSKVVRDLEQRPAHIVYSFDQSSYDLTKTTRSGHLVVSPLVVTYKYGYDEAYKKGEISPSSDADSGIFADYHYLLNQAIDLQEDQSFQVQIGSGSEVVALNTLLSTQSTRWLAVADRTMLGYAPQEAVPLLEQLQGRREVAVWAHATSRSVRQFVDILCTFNLLPDEAHITHLMQQYGHIAAGGLFSAVRANTSQRDQQRKGLIGTVVAAHWYALRYPGALIASLDSGLARQWLTLEAATRERADLIGLREDEQGNLVIDVIEVKAVADSSKEVQVGIDPQTRRTTLAGHAIGQLRTTLAAIEPIFALREEQYSLFTQASREALKYQLYRECFRELHVNADQFRWYKLLNRAFREDLNGTSVTVICRGIVVHTLFEEHGDTEVVSDSTAAISLVRLRDEAIQRLVGTPAPDASSRRVGTYRLARPAIISKCDHRTFVGCYSAPLQFTQMAQAY